MTERNYIWCCLSLHCHFQRECVYANMIIGSLHFISALSLCVNNVLQHCNFFNPNLSLGKHTKCQIGTSTFGKMLSVSSQQLHVCLNWLEMYLTLFESVQTGASSTWVLLTQNDCAPLTLKYKLMSSYTHTVIPISYTFLIALDPENITNCLLDSQSVNNHSKN